MFALFCFLLRTYLILCILGKCGGINEMNEHLIIIPNCKMHLSTTLLGRVPPHTRTLMYFSTLHGQMIEILHQSGKVEKVNCRMSPAFETLHNTSCKLA